MIHSGRPGFTALTILLLTLRESPEVNGYSGSRRSLEFMALIIVGDRESARDVLLSPALTHHPAQALYQALLHFYEGDLDAGNLFSVSSRTHSTQPRLATLRNTSRTSSACRVTPVFEKMDFN